MDHSWERLRTQVPQPEEAFSSVEEFLDSLEAAASHLESLSEEGGWRLLHQQQGGRLHGADAEAASGAPGPALGPLLAAHHHLHALIAQAPGPGMLDC
jgi:hypothetical protein